MAGALLHRRGYWWPSSPDLFEDLPMKSRPHPQDPGGQPRTIEITTAVSPR